jgi:hypothetical protein
MENPSNACLAGEKSYHRARVSFAFFWDVNADSLDPRRLSAARNHGDAMRVIVPGPRMATSH